MAAKAGATSSDIIDLLLKDGGRFSFFQAVYLLDQYFGKSHKEEQNSVVDEKSIKLVPSLSMGFPASDIVRIEKDGDSFVVETTLLGLYGSYSPLPAFYTEEILWNEQSQIYVKGFLDLFHHRLLSLLYKSWCKYRFHIQFRAGGEDPFSRMMLSLSGMNMAKPHKEDPCLSPVGLLKFSGLLTQRPKSSSALKNILNSFFSDAVIKIKELVGKWIDIISEQRNSLGALNSQLGVSLSLGKKVFDRAGNFRVIVCPDNFKAYLNFLPGEIYFRRIMEVTRLFIPGNLLFDLELKFPPGKVPGIPLKSSGQTMRLGFTSWLGDISGNTSIILSQGEESAL